MINYIYEYNRSTTKYIEVNLENKHLFYVKYTWL